MAKVGKPKGYKMSEETKLKISTSRINKMIKPSTEAIEKASEAKKKKVRLGNKIYNSVQEAAVALGVSPTRVTAYIRNKTIIPLKFIE